MDIGNSGAGTCGTTERSAIIQHITIGYTHSVYAVEEAWFAGPVLVGPQEGLLLELVLHGELGLLVIHPLLGLLDHVSLLVQLGNVLH